MTYRELIYIVLDQIKASSDDSYITEDHVLFLANKVRALLLKQRYSDVKREIPLSNYQTICIPLEKIGGSFCTEKLLKSSTPIPTTMTVGKTYVGNGIDSNITLVSKDRFKYVGINKWLKNFAYATIDNNNYLYIKSQNPQTYYLESIEVSAIFEDPKSVESFCNESCDFWDNDYPLEESLVSSVIDLIIKYVSGAVLQPTDSTNNANDDLSSVQNFIRNNMKEKYLKQQDQDD
jgi:hypothetical protein